MVEERDYYEVLQLHPNAEPEVIESAFRRLALKYHPDKGGSNERMAELNRAYAVLSNPEQRGAYDAAWLQSSVPGTGEANNSAASDAPGDSAPAPPTAVAVPPGSPFRWLLVIPAALVGSLLSMWILGWILSKYGPQPPFSFLQQAFVFSLWGATLSVFGIGFAVLTAPSHRRTVATVAGTVYILLSGFLMYPALDNGQPWMAFSMFISAVSAVMVTIQVRDALKR